MRVTTFLSLFLRRLRALPYLRPGAAEPLGRSAVREAGTGGPRSFPFPRSAGALAPLLSPLEAHVGTARSAGRGLQHLRRRPAPPS